MTPESELGMIILASITLVGSFLMGVLKLCETNGGKCTHKSCCGQCEYDLRKPETKQLELNSQV